MWNKTNIEEELQQLQPQNHNEIFDNFIANQNLRTSTPEEDLNSRLAKEGQSNAFNIDLLDSSRVYTIENIEKICVLYRLRFLSIKYFKPQLPKEAVQKMSRLEEEHLIRLQGLKVMAPSKLFKLEDKDDPLLFAPIGNGYYYLIHKWGSDLSWYRKGFVWPMRGPVHLLIALALLSFILTSLIPSGLFSKNEDFAQWFILYMFMFKGVVGITVFYAFALGKNFNPFIWNSKYFNA
ncbi:MAG: hypothetical protein CMC18_06270 [Flavobacteriaceae bacterium]|nr:hypothetical protein [Flavobacteriaceae bacterium]